MRAVACSAFGPLSGLAIEDRPKVIAGPGQVVIDVAAAGVNFVDALFVQGQYQIKPPLPFTPGMEVAGTISALGEGAAGADLGLAVGDRVLAMPWMGGYASQVAVAAGLARRVPDAMSMGQAASFIQSYATSLFALRRRTDVEAGETLVVLGAGGGVGLAATDLATALGLRVIAVASTPEKRAAALAAGAVKAIDPSDGDLKSHIRDLTDRGADIVLDPVGGSLSESALRATRVGGRFIVIGFAAGQIPSIPLNQVLLNNRTVVGVDWGAWAMGHAAENLGLVDELLAMVAAGQLHPAEPTPYPLDRVAEALADLQERRIGGKVVLVP